jgi:acyl-CoA synthetase (AMP-forming)/AMP-acid ligase II
MNSLQHIITIGGERESDRRIVPFEELVETSGADSKEPSQEIARAAPGDIFAIIYTSGTTGGEPKGAIHTHESFGCELLVGADIWIPEGERRAPLVVFPPGHIAGFAYSLMPIIDGSGAVYMDSWNAAAAASLVERYDLAWAFGTPFHLTTLLEAAAPGQLTRIRMFGCGGASVPPSLIERADTAGVKAFRAYGSTEHPSISSGRRGDSLRIRAYTDGRPMPGVEVRILDADNALCGAGEFGEIVTRGPELFRGYLAAKHDAEALQDGWYRTGDLGEIDSEGALTIVDRKKDIIIRGGENISSKEVEDIILQIDGVLAVAVIGWPDERYGERVAAFVQTKSGRPLKLETVTEHFKNSGTARFKTPERLMHVDDFERSAAGKILKVPLRAHAARLAAEGGA